MFTARHISVAATVSAKWAISLGRHADILTTETGRLLQNVLQPTRTVHQLALKSRLRGDTIRTGRRLSPDILLQSKNPHTEGFYFGGTYVSLLQLKLECQKSFTYQPKRELIDLLLTANDSWLLVASSSVRRQYLYFILGNMFD